MTAVEKPLSTSFWAVPALSRVEPVTASGPLVVYYPSWYPGEHKDVGPIEQIAGVSDNQPGLIKRFMLDGDAPRRANQVVVVDGEGRYAGLVMVAEAHAAELIRQRFPDVVATVTAPGDGAGVLAAGLVCMTLGWI